MNGPHGVLEIQGLLVSFSPEGKNITSDAADGGAHPKMRKYGDMMESVDVSDSKSDGREAVWVRVPLSPPKSN